MSKLTRKQLKKAYSYANEDYLVAMVEGKIYVSNYMLGIKKQLNDEFENVYLPMIENIFVEYLNDKKRNYFLPEDVSMKKKWMKKVKSILNDYAVWCDKIFVLSISEIYNYKRLYNLWMISKVYGADEDEYDKPLVGEADEGDKIKGVIDPTFTKEKLDGLISSKPYGKTYAERSAEAVDTALTNVDKSVNGVLSGKGKELNTHLKRVEKTLRKDVVGKMNTAISFGIEDAEDFGDYDVFSANPFFGAKYQRVEILDKRTCLVCADLDGKLYKEPIGRVHPHCRGIDVPIDEAENKTALREMSTKAKRRKSFDNWFNGLSDKEQRSLLGKTKYEMYRSGKINVHDLVKQNRVIGVKEIKRIEQLKTIPSIKDDLGLARDVIKNESKKLPQRSIPKLKTQEEVNAYYRYLNKKESIYRSLETSALKKSGVNRNSLNAEVNRERKLIRLKEKEIALDSKLKKQK